MAKVDPDVPLVLPLLDRLIDEDPSSPADKPLGRGAYLERLRASVRRDLEGLLNTRRRVISWAAELSELDTSSLNYGVIDITSANLATEDQRERFRVELERTIRRFEPRFHTLRVILLENAQGLDRTLRFRIEATLHASPAPEPVVYDSMLDPAARLFRVIARDDA